uniref:Beta-lactamase-related domain-containing protein n=1 Tax=Plectus sambesii TaxID=2011161 RepID=A0A914W313_9BILA
MFSILALLSLHLIVVLSQQLPEHFGGKVDDRFRRVQQAFIDNFRRGYDTEGAAFVVYENSRLVVDLWGGYADREAAKKWREDTMSVAFSSTKAVLALVIALLNSRGKLQYTDTVAKYWPEFAQNGKDNITIDMVMNHRAGLVYLDQGIQVEDVESPTRMSLLFENARPNYPAGSMTVYHEFTYGWLVDQIVRRVDGQQRGVAEFLQDEVIRPNGISFYIGLPIELQGK